MPISSHEKTTLICFCVYFRCRCCGGRWGGVVLFLLPLEVLWIWILYPLPVASQDI